MTDWNIQVPSDDEFANTLGKHIRDTKYGVQKQIDIEHDFRLGEHRAGKCGVAYIGSRNSFPTDNKKGAIAYDKNEGLFVNDNGWVNTAKAGAVPLIPFGNPARTGLTAGGHYLTYECNWESFATVFDKTFNFGISFQRVFFDITLTIQHITTGRNNQGHYHFQYLNTSPNVLTQWTTFWAGLGTITYLSTVQTYRAVGVLTLPNVFMPLQIRLQIRNSNSYRIRYGILEGSYAMAVI